MKRVLVCGAGGFIGDHLARRLVAEGHWVRGVDTGTPRYGDIVTHEYQVADLRDPTACQKALEVEHGFDEVYQLAADMGGMGFIEAAECEIMRNNVLINANVVHAAAEAGVGRYFFASSVCVYRDMAEADGEVGEDFAYPANPDNEYGWEKLYSERMLATYARRYGFHPRIGRFQNCYGPRGPWTGGREKAPSALCRKVAEAVPGGTVEVWGDGSAVRSFIYIDDLVEGVLAVMRSDVASPVNIGVPERVTVAELVAAIADVAGKTVHVKWVPGPVGVHNRHFGNAALQALGWRPRYTLSQGLSETYPWIESQVNETVLSGGGHQ